MVLMPRSTIISRAVPRGTRPPIEMPDTATVGGTQLAQLLGLFTDEVAVTDRAVKGLPALNAALDIVANGVASMMSSAKVFSADDNELTTPPIISRPNTLFGCTEFWNMAVRSLVARGNFIAVLADYDVTGWPRQVVPVDATAVAMDVTSGLPVYTINNATYTWDQVVHVRKGAPIGTLWGEGVVGQYRRALSGMLHEQAYGESSWRSGAVPSAVIQLDVPSVSKEVAEGFQDRWQEAHGRGQRKPAVIPKTMSITPLSWSPEDAEFAESRRITMAEAALMVGLVPSDIEATLGGGSSLTYANLTDRQLSRIVQSFAPWMNLLEEAFSDVLPGGQKVRGNPEALLRSTTRERYELHELATRIGLYPIGHAQELERLPSYTKPAPAPPPEPPSEPTEVAATEEGSTDDDAAD